MTAFSELATKPIPPVEPGQAETLIRLTEHAELATEAGVVPGYEDWPKMGWLERRAWRAAAVRSRGLAAQRAGLASLGPLGAALAGADADGGAAAEAVYMTALAAKVVASVEAEGHVT
jgi:hypothetical protein